MANLGIAECLGEDFLAQALHRDYRHVPNAFSPEALLTWDDLNHILATQPIEPPQLRLNREGQSLSPLAWSEPLFTRRNVVMHRLHPAQLHARLAEGRSLILDSVDQLHRPLGVVGEELERLFRCRFQSNLYASWTAVPGSGIHWDTHDVLVFQLDGAKRWQIHRPTTRRYPLYEDSDEPAPPTGEPVADLVLQAGDLLYLPRGWWHAVSADQGTRSLHVTYGFETHTPVGLLQWIADQLLAYEDFRADLPRFAAPGEQAVFLAKVRKLVIEQLEDPQLLVRFTADLDGKYVGRMAPSLPYVDSVPADPGLRVRMTTTRASLTATDGTVHLAAAGTVYEFAREAGPALRALVDGGEHTLGDLAETAGLDVGDVAGLVHELVQGQAVTLSGCS
ncbi:cupin domain-containing protein [Streptomyces sp. NPDC101150]|uniref:cupin domain-containing protein n=1 Tax=Streptomyces sp. NPDC101150 TaxID=3366114 RepID=UPI003830E58D